MEILANHRDSGYTKNAFGGTMMARLHSVVAGLLILPLAAVGPAHAAQYKIRWALSHSPDEFFTEAAQEFSERVARESGGAISVEVIRPVKKGDGKLPPGPEVIAAVSRGDFEMSQVFTTAMGSTSEKLWVL